MTIETSKSLNRFNALHGLVLLIGLLVFVLLFLANKTHLESSKADALEGNASSESSESSTPPPVQPATDEMLMSLPPANPDPGLDSLQHALDHAQQAEDRAILYQGIVEAHRANGRLDFAAVYAGALADEQPELRNLVVAGALFRNAVFMEHFQADSALYRRFSDEAMRHLRKAESLDAKNEDALLELGLAMVESRLPELGMEGILKIRTVTEINPKNTEALYRLGVFSMDTKQYDKAEARFRQVLEIEPGNLSAQFLLGLACQQLGKTAEFERILRALAGQSEDLQLAERAKALLNQP